MVSSAAFAQGTPPCRGFEIENLTGPQCQVTGGGEWELQWTVNAPAIVQVTVEGCDLDAGPDIISDGHIANYQFDEVTCTLSITTEEVDSNGAVLCAEVLQHDFVCPG